MATATDPVTPVPGAQEGDTAGVASVTAVGRPSPTLSGAPRPEDPPAAVDDEALAGAFVDHGPAMRSLARRALGTVSAAEEAVQETFARAWRSRRHYDPSRGSLRTWLFSIERNLLVDLARSGVRAGHRDSLLVARPEAAPDQMERALSSLQVEDALRRLSEDHRAVVVEIYFGGRTSREAAGRLGIPEGTVRTRLFYALKALRTALRDRGWEA